jgi:hypothetical protein
MSQYEHKIVKKLKGGKLVDVPNVYKDDSDKYYIDVTDVVKDFKERSNTYFQSDVSIVIEFDAIEMLESRKSLSELSPEVKIKLAKAGFDYNKV